MGKCQETGIRQYLKHKAKKTIREEGGKKIGD